MGETCTKLETSSSAEAASCPEEPLPGIFSTPLRHLERVGFDGAPHVLGIDAQGREVLTYVPGNVPRDASSPEIATDRALSELSRPLCSGASTRPSRGSRSP
jgi:hypothetical protein